MNPISTARGRRDTRQRIKARLASLRDPSPEARARAAHIQQRLDRYASMAAPVLPRTQLRKAADLSKERGPLARRILLTQLARVT